MAKIKVAIVGVGNCASSLVQGIEYYKGKKPEDAIGLMHWNIGGYLVEDSSVVTAFDINLNKVGKDISEAIFAEPNNAKKFADIPRTDVVVSPGRLLDGIAPHIDNVPIIDNPNSVTIDDVVRVFKKSGAEMLINYLPTGSRKATDFYATACSEANVAYIGAQPDPIASDPKWIRRFEATGTPCAGDDIMSQVGATIVHRALAELIRERGSTIDGSFQLDYGGNMDFRNLENQDRRGSKLKSKTDSVIHSAGTDQIIIVPAGYIHFLGDRKIAYIEFTGTQFGGSEYKIQLRMEVEDSPNSAGVMMDVIRLMRTSLDRGLAGYQPWSAYYFKRPLKFMPLEEARKAVEYFIRN